jgi:hypothetical protein
MMDEQGFVNVVFLSVRADLEHNDSLVGTGPVV